MAIPAHLVKPASAALVAVVAAATIGVILWQRLEASREERRAIKMLPHVDIQAYNDLFLP